MPTDKGLAIAKHNDRSERFQFPMAELALRPESLYRASPRAGFSPDQSAKHNVRDGPSIVTSE